MKRILECAAGIFAFILVPCAILNIVIYDNIFIKFVGIWMICIELLLLLDILLCQPFGESRKWIVLQLGLLLLGIIMSAIGLTGNIFCYKCGNAFALINGIWCLLYACRILINSKAFVLFKVIIPFAVALAILAEATLGGLLWGLDQYIRFSGDKKLTPVVETPYEVVNKEIFQTYREYSIIYYPEVAEETTLPVIGFVHGYFPFNISDFYEDLLVNLAANGFVVISVNYEHLLTPSNLYTNYAAMQMLDGIAYAESISNIRLAYNDEGLLQFGLMGHSAGGVTALNLSSAYEDFSLPKPMFVMTFCACDGGDNLVPMYDLTTVDSDTNILMTFGFEDDENAWATNHTYWNQLNVEKKQFNMMYPSQSTDGKEFVTAGHSWMVEDEAGSSKYLIYNGAFKWSVALANYSFYGIDFDEWYGEDAVADMGTYKDGSKVKSPQVINDGEIIWE